jgi:hypothetical protein
MGLGHAFAVIVLGVGPLLAAASCVGPSPDVDAMLAYWQKRQHFDDWNIKVKIAPQSEMAGLLGTIDWDGKTRQATIRLLDPADYRGYGHYDCRDALGARDIRNDMENSLIHELLHLVLAPLKATGSRNEEWAVLELTDALQVMRIPGNIDGPQHGASVAEVRRFVESKIAAVCRNAKPVDPNAREQVVKKLVDAFRALHAETTGTR